MFDQIRIDGTKEVTKVQRIFRASEDGWDPKDFHRHCDRKGPTLCLIRSDPTNYSDDSEATVSQIQSDKRYLAAGFTSKPWTSDEDGVNVEDASAMLFALTKELQVFKPGNPKEAVYHYSQMGPHF